MDQPNIEQILAAFAKVANRVAARVLEDQEDGGDESGPVDLENLRTATPIELARMRTDYYDTPLLHALSAAVQAIGSEYGRQTHAGQVAQAGSRVHLQ